MDTTRPMPPAEKLYEEVQLLKQENAALRQQLTWCKAQMFGPGKSETLDRLQTTLALPVPAPQKTETIVYERRAWSRFMRRISSATAQA